MSQVPAMPMWWGDYWSKTRRLSPAQHHAYLFLLGATWMNNGQPFPDDDQVIAGEIGISVAAWKRNRPALERFFDLSGGFWRNKKLEEVWSSVIARVEKNRENGHKGGRPAKSGTEQKTQQNQTEDKPDGYPVGLPDESIARATPKPKPNIEDPPSPSEKAPPRGVDPVDEPSEVTSNRDRGGRLPDDFVVPQSWKEAGLEARNRLKPNAWPISIEAEATSFVLFWTGKTGSGATKKNWERTFLNWCLNAKGTPPLEAPRSWQRKANGQTNDEGYRPAFIDYGPVNADTWRGRLRILREKGRWVRDPAMPVGDAQWDWGPRPGEPGCLIPAEVLAEFGYGEPDSGEQDSARNPGEAA